jgi:uncharacterized membrane protein YphA (DoxX/SURF4 family)
MRRFRVAVEVPMYEALFRNTLAPLVLRLTLAAIFIYHGLEKVKDHNLGSSWASDAWAAMKKLPESVEEKLSGKSPHALSRVEMDRVRAAWAIKSGEEEMPAALDIAAAQLAVAWGELLGGLAMLVGLLTRLAALGLIIIQLGAIYTVTFEKGFSVAGGLGFEYNVAIIAICLALLFWGSGNLSVDAMFRRKPRSA